MAILAVLLNYKINAAFNQLRALISQKLFYIIVLIKIFFFRDFIFRFFFFYFFFFLYFLFFIFFFFIVPVVNMTAL